MKTHLLFWAVILTICALLSGCGNLAGFSAEYKAAHEATFWKEYKGGGVDAMAIANLKAHEAAEKQVGR